MHLIQNATLTAIDTRWRRILQKCKVPTQQDSEGGGSTGTAMDMSSGWSAAEIDAVREETDCEQRHSREELKLIIKVLQLTPSNVLKDDDPIKKSTCWRHQFPLLKKKEL